MFAAPTNACESVILEGEDYDLKVSISATSRWEPGLSVIRCSRLFGTPPSNYKVNKSNAWRISRRRVKRCVRQSPKRLATKTGNKQTLD